MSRPVVESTQPRIGRIDANEDDEFISFNFVPLFFASSGLKVNFITHFDLPLVVLALILACTGKLFGAVLGLAGVVFHRASSGPSVSL